jgi:hypothetical protein
MSVVAALIYITTNSILGILSPVSLPAFVASFLDESHSGWGDMEISVVFIGISFMVEDVEHCFMYLLEMCTLLRTAYSGPLAHLFIGLFLLLVFNFLSS